MNFDLAEKLLVAMMTGRTPTRDETDEIINAAIYVAERYEELLPGLKEAPGPGAISYLSRTVGRGKG